MCRITRSHKKALQIRFKHILPGGEKIIYLLINLYKNFLSLILKYYTIAMAIKKERKEFFLKKNKGFGNRSELT